MLIKEDKRKNQTKLNKKNPLKKKIKELYPHSKLLSSLVCFLL